MDRFNIEQLEAMLRDVPDDQKEGFFWVAEDDHLAKLKAVEGDYEQARNAANGWATSHAQLEAFVERVRQELLRRVAVLEKDSAGLSQVNRLTFEDEARAYRAAAELLADSGEGV